MEKRLIADIFNKAHISTSSDDRFRASRVSATSDLFSVLNAFKTELRFLMDAMLAVNQAAAPATPAFQAPAALSGPAVRVLDSSDEDEIDLTTTISTGGTALPAYPSPSLRPGAAAAAARMGATPAPVGTTTTAPATSSGAK